MSSLVKLDSIDSRHYMQHPRWLSNRGLSPTAKVIYVLLLDRMRVSRKNGWVNQEGEVYLVFSREELSKATEVGKKAVCRAMQELREKDLIREVRRGLGNPNLIFLVQQEQPPRSSRKAPRKVTEPAPQSPPIAPGETPQPAPQEEAIPPANQNNQNQNNFSHPNLSQTNRVRETDGPTAEEEKLVSVLKGCDLQIFSPEEQEVLRSAVERLFYSQSYRLGDAVMPQSSIRAWLGGLDATILQDVLCRLRKNRSKVKNPFGYVMTTLLNCLSESKSELLVDPYLNGNLAWEDSL